MCKIQSNKIFTVLIMSTPKMILNCVTLLDRNLQILFSQERTNLSKKLYFNEVRQLVSQSLHGNRSHIVILGFNRVF